MVLEYYKQITQKCDWYFVRHGESEGNKQHIIQGHADFPLSDLGREHAHSAGRWFENKKIDLVLSSPLKRAHTTAQLIKEHLDGYEAEEIVPCKDLMELDTGVFSGKDRGAIQREMADTWDAFRIHSWEAVPGAEAITSLQGRAMAHWKYLVELGNQGINKVISVTHGGLLQWLFRTSFGAEASWMPLIRVHNCGIFHFRIEPVSSSNNEQGFYAEWKEIDHLPYEDGLKSPAHGTAGRGNSR